MTEIYITVLIPIRLLGLVLDRCQDCLSNGPQAIILNAITASLCTHTEHH